jgi:EF-P beta-lysylation protein EpmB
MRPGDPSDPLLRQVLPLGAERAEVPGFSADPLAERDDTRVPGLLQKYHGRVLLVATGACAVHCRYCFRREFPYGEHLGGAPLEAAVEAIAGDASIDEVILSGGDPLSLSDARLAAITTALAGIPHLRRLRVHTRQPIVLPSRVDAGLLAWLASLPWPTVFVLHVNHAAELDAGVVDALVRLRAAGATLLSQSVLLRGVNDEVGVLEALSRRLFEAGVLPYYLHLLDRVRGSAHFEVPEAEARALMRSLAARLPGYLVPRLVREVAGEAAKRPIAALP